MSPDTLIPDSTTDAQELADEVLQISTNEAAASRSTIASIENRIHSVTQQIVVEPDTPLTVPSDYTVPDDSGEIAAAGEDFAQAVEEIAQKEHASRMQNYEGNTELRIDNTEDNVGGYYGGDGTFIANDVVQGASDAENTRIYNHEWKGHQEVGLPTGNLDAQIASDEELKAAVAEEMRRMPYEVTDETDVPIEEVLEENAESSPDQIRKEVADQVVASVDGSTQTVRNAEETWAVAQEGVAASGPYVPEHLEPMGEIQDEAAGVEGSYDAAFNSLVHSKDNTKMVQLIARSKLREAGLSPSVN